jgi:hypothetical protein
MHLINLLEQNINEIVILTYNVLGFVIDILILVLLKVYTAAKSLSLLLFLEDFKRGEFCSICTSTFILLKTQSWASKSIAWVSLYTVRGCYSDLFL